jgi:hypothetical protein
MIATSRSGHSMLANWSCVVSRTNPAYTSSTRGGRARSSSSRSHGQGRIDYSAPKARTSQIPGTSNTCASSTHKQTPSDIRIPRGLGRSPFPDSYWRLRATIFGLHIPSPAHDSHGHGRNSRVSWLLVVNKVMTTFTTYRLYFLSNHPLRLKLLDISSSAVTLGGRTRPKSHFVQLS